MGKLLQPMGGGPLFFPAEGGRFFQNRGGAGGGPLEKKFPRIFKESHSSRKTAPKIDITNLLEKCSVFFTKL